MWKTRDEGVGNEFVVVVRGLVNKLLSNGTMKYTTVLTAGDFDSVVHDDPEFVVLAQFAPQLTMQEQQRIGFQHRLVIDSPQSC